MKNEDLAQMYQHTARKTSFESVAELYNRYRPGYAPQLFEFLINRFSINSAKNLLEIGCGSGQATKGFQKTGAQIVGIDISSSLINLAEYKFRTNKNIQFQKVSLEESTFQDGSFDLIYAAQSFHWIEPKTGYSICSKKLRSNGGLALIWNSCPYIPNELRAELDLIGNRYGLLPNLNSPGRPELSENVEKRASDIQNLNLFKSTTLHCFDHEVVYSTESYAGLLQTYSDHALLPSQTRSKLLNEVSGAIEDLGGTIPAFYKTRLILCQ